MIKPNWDHAGEEHVIGNHCAARWAPKAWMLHPYKHRPLRHGLHLRELISRNPYLDAFPCATITDPPWWSCCMACQRPRQIFGPRRRFVPLPLSSTQITNYDEPAAQEAQPGLMRPTRWTRPLRSGKQIIRVAASESMRHPGGRWHSSGAIESDGISNP